MISFENLVLIFYSQVPNTTIEGTMEKKSVHFATPFRRLSKYIMVLINFSIYLTVLAPRGKYEK